MDFQSIPQDQDGYREGTIPDEFGCSQSIRFKRLVGDSLCVECGQAFTEDNPAGGNEGYLKHQNGCKRNPHHPPQF